MLQGGIQYNETRLIPNYDKNGRIYYTDENGNKIENQTNFVQRLANNTKAFLSNANDWLNNSNPDSEDYKQKANIALTLATLPIGAGAKVTQTIAKPLVPYVGKQIAKTIGQGVGAGAASGAVEGFGRGLIEKENPILTAATDSLLGTVFGGLGGLGVGNITKQIARKNLVNNAQNQAKYIQNYIEGLSDNAEYVGQRSRLAKELAVFRGAKQGYFKGNTKSMPNFIGENAFNAPKGKLMEAKQMAMYGDSNADIKNATGWFKGVDGKWRYEIPDGRMIDNPNLVKEFDDDIGTYYTGKLSDIYDAPGLYQAYPQLKNRDIIIQNMPDGYGGSSWGDSISLNRNYFQKDNPEFLKLKNELENTPEYAKYNSSFDIDTGNPVEDLKIIENAEKEFFDSDIGKKYYSLMWGKNTPVPRKIEGFNDDALKTLVHEAQHQIQSIEDFAKGGMGERPDYWNLAGEAEARLAGARAKLTPEQRQIYNPANESTYLTNYGYDVIPEKQIVEFRKDTPANSLKYRDEWVKIGNKDYRILNLPKKDYGKILHNIDTYLKPDDMIGETVDWADDIYKYTFQKVSPTDYKFIKRKKLK